MKTLCSLFLLCAALFAPLASAQIFRGNESIAQDNNGPRRIEILRALYGAKGFRPHDATYVLQGLVNSGARSIVVGTSSMGADPAPGQAKTLHIKYRVGRRTITKVINEGAIFAPTE